jgi:outer membrane protein insertion porin family
VWGQQPAAPAIVVFDSIHVTGNTRVATPVILSDMGVRPGDDVNLPDIQRGIQRLYATGQFDDIRVYAAEVNLTTVLIIEVIERPFIVGFAFRGSQHVSSGGIRDTAGLERDAPLDPNAVHQAEFHIRSDLSSKGYVQARVDTTLVATERPGEYQLVFEVDEGRRLVVAAIEIEGNEFVADWDIIGAMSVKPEGFFWWQSGEFREEEYRQDTEIGLVEFYGSQGYLDFQVLGDSMVVDPQTGKTKLIIQVDEGRLYRIGDFQVEGNNYFPTEMLELRFNPQSRSLLSRLPLVGSAPDLSDPVFDTRTWQEATEQINSLYRNAGFLYAQIQPLVERMPIGEDGDERVRLIWRIEEGDQAYVHLVNIAGNSTTHERVIRDRLVLLPGDVYGDERIVNSYQTVQGLGFFEPLPPNEALGVRPTESGDIDITFRVQEKQTGNINFGASLSPSAGMAGFIGYEQPNLFGQAKVGRFRWVFGTRSNDIEVGYSDPALLGSRNSLGLTLRSSRDQFSYVGLGRRRQVGGSIVFGMPFLRSRWTRISFRYTLLRDSYDDSSQEDLDFEERQLLNVGTRSGFEIAVARDTRNHPLFPTRGSRNAAGIEFVGGPLGGDGDYRKISFESAWFTPIANLRSDPTKTGIELSLGLGISGGLIQGNNPFYLERFFMGGVQYGPKLRGYEELTITPFGHVPRGAPGFSQLDRVGSSYFHFASSIGMNLGGNLFVNAFYEAGNVWSNAIGLNPNNLLRGAGFGASIVTPMGPIGLDYAYGFDRRDVFGNPDPGWRLHFRFGQIY